MIKDFLKILKEAIRRYRQKQKNNKYLTPIKRK